MSGEALVRYLSQLNSAETQCSLYVNPQDLDDFRVGQNIFENGGLLDGKVSVGTLESLSFGFQSTVDTVKQWLEDNNDQFEYGGRRVRVNRKGLMDAYGSYLDDDFQGFLEEQAEEVKSIWAEEEASCKVDELRVYFAPGGAWEQEMVQQVQEEEARQSWLRQQMEQEVAECY